MDVFIESLIKAFLLLFLAMDTIGNIPVFVMLTAKMQPEKKRKNVYAALLVASGLLLLFLIAGGVILKFFNIEIADFKVAGGIVLGLIGLRLVLNLRMLEDRAEKYANAIVPMATPLITGPAAITAVIINVDTYGYLIAIIAALLNIGFAWIVLARTDFFFKLLGRQGADVVSKIFGLILVAIAIGYIRGGVSFVALT
jgi:multiple antibiotic resistance protein